MSSGDGGIDFVAGSITQIQKSATACEYSQHFVGLMWARRRATYGAAAPQYVLLAVLASAAAVTLAQTFVYCPNGANPSRAPHDVHIILSSHLF